MRGLLLFFTAVAVLAAVVPFGLKQYRAWRARQLVERAFGFLQTNDVKSASISAMQAYYLSNTSREAIRAMAVVATLQANPSALTHWQRLVTDWPSERTNYLEYAQAAIRFGQNELAVELIEKVKPDFGQTPRWLNLASQAAIARGDFATAQTHLEELCRVDPTVLTHRLNRAAVAIHAVDPAIKQKAIDELLELAQKPELARDAYRSLASYYDRFQDPKESAQYWEKVLQLGPPSWQERLWHLDALWATDRPRAEARLLELDEQARKEPNGQYTLGFWYSRHERPADTWRLVKDTEWEKAVPERYFLAADALIALKNWPALDQLLTASTPPEIEFLRVALQAYSYRAQGSASQYARAWTAAVSLATDIPRQMQLAEQAYRWGWEQQAVELWEKVGREKDWGVLGLRKLVLYHAERRDRPRLREVLLRMNKLFPNDPVVAADLAAVSFVLNQDLEQAHAWAEQAYKVKPTDPVFGATYGLSLYLRGRAAEARPIYDQLEGRVSHPSFALNYAMILTATGAPQKAAELLKPVKPDMLAPVEQTWLAKTQAELAKASGAGQ